MGYKKQRILEDIFDICAMLPWWVGVTTAVIIHLVLHQYAVAEIVNSGNPSQLVSDNIIKSLAKVMQYIIPLACLGGSLISFIKRKDW